MRSTVRAAKRDMMNWYGAWLLAEVQGKSTQRIPTVFTEVADRFIRTLSAATGATVLLSDGTVRIRRAEDYL